MENYNSDSYRCCSKCNERFVMPMRKNNMARYAFELDRLGRLNTNIDIGNDMNKVVMPDTSGE